MTPTTSKRLRRAGTALGLLMGLPAIAVGLFYSAPGQNYVRGLIEKEITGRMAGGNATIGSLALSPFSGVVASSVSLKAADGVEALNLKAVEVIPRWRDTLDGRPTFSRLVARDVTVNVRQAADGTTNISTLFKPPVPGPGPAGKPPGAITVEQFDVSGVRVLLEGADGTKVSLEDAGLSGTLVARPATNGLDLVVSRLGFSLGLKRADGLEIGLRNLHWGLEAHLEQGAGPVTLRPLEADLVLSLPSSSAPQKSRLSFGETTLTLGEGELGIAGSKLAGAAVALEAVSLSGKFSGGALAGEQKANVVGLRIDKDKLHELLGRKVLAADVRVGLRVGGRPEKLGLEADLESAGQRVALSGSIDAHERLTLGYDLALRSERLALPELLAIETPPAVEARDLTLSVKGHGLTRLDAAVDVGLSAGPLTLRGTQLSRVELDAHFERGEITIKKLHVLAVGQELDISGKYRLADGLVTADIKSVGALAPTLAKLREAGVAVPPSPLLSTLTLSTSGVAAHVEGSLATGLKVDVPDLRVTVAGGGVQMRATADLVAGDESKGERPVKARSIEADIKLSGMPLGKLVALRGGEQLLDGLVSGELKVRGTPESPQSTFELRGTAAATGALSKQPVGFTLKGKATRGRLTAHARVDYDGQAGARAAAQAGPGSFLDADLDLPLAGQGLDTRAPWAIKIDMPRRSFASIAQLLPPDTRARARLPEHGDAELHADLKGSGAHPAGTVSLDAQGDMVPGGTQRLKLEASIGAGDGESVAVGYSLLGFFGREAPGLKAKGSVALARSPLLEREPALTWDADVDLAEDVAALPLPPERKGLGGKIKAHAVARGTRQDLEGKLDFEGRGLGRSGEPPLDLDASASLLPAGTTLKAAGRFGGLDAFSIAGQVGIGGAGILGGGGDRPEPTVALQVEFPTHDLAAWAAVSPGLSGMPGQVGGKVGLNGSATALKLSGAVKYSGYQTLSGKPGEVVVGVGGSLAGAKLTATLPSGFSLDATVSPAALLAARFNDTPSPVRTYVQIKGQGPLADVLPDGPRVREAGLAGKVAADLAIEAKLIVSKVVFEPVLSSFTGSLQVDEGSLVLPGTRRTLQGITIRLRGEDDVLLVEQLVAHESNAARSDRKLTVGGKVAFDRAGIGRIDAKVRSEDFLLFGGRFGSPAAPLAAVSADLTVSGSLSGGRQLDLDVASFALSPPPGGAQPALSLDDLLGVTLPSRVSKVPQGNTTAEADPGARAPGGAPLAIKVRIARPLRLRQAPMDLDVQGEFLITRLASGERKASGKLDVVGGKFLVGGKPHDVERGELRFTDEGTLLDLTLKDGTSPTALLGGAGLDAPGGLQTLLPAGRTAQSAPAVRR